MFIPGEDEEPFRLALEGDPPAPKPPKYPPVRQLDIEGVTYVAEKEEEYLRPTITDKTLLTATVWFEDAKGNRWETIFRAPAVERPKTDHSINSTFHVSLRRLHR